MLKPRARPSCSTRPPRSGPEMATPPWARENAGSGKRSRARSFVPSKMRSSPPFIRGVTVSASSFASEPLSVAKGHVHDADDALVGVTLDDTAHELLWRRHQARHGSQCLGQVR